MWTTPGLGPCTCSPAHETVDLQGQSTRQCSPLCPGEVRPHPSHSALATASATCPVGRGTCSRRLLPVPTPSERGCSVGAQDSGLGRTASPTPGPSGCRDIRLVLYPHFSPSRGPAATHLIPGVTPWPGRSSGGLQDRTEGSVRGSILGVPRSGRGPTLTWHSKEQHCGGTERTLDDRTQPEPCWGRGGGAADGLDSGGGHGGSGGGQRRQRGRGMGGQGRGSYHLLHVVFLKSETEKRN